MSKNLILFMVCEKTKLSIHRMQVNIVITFWEVNEQFSMHFELRITLPFVDFFFYLIEIQLFNLGI